MPCTLQCIGTRHTCQCLYESMTSPHQAPSCPQIHTHCGLCNFMNKVILLTVWTYGIACIVIGGTWWGGAVETNMPYRTNMPLLVSPFI